MQLDWQHTSASRQDYLQSSPSPAELLMACHPTQKRFLVEPMDTCGGHCPLFPSVSLISWSMEIFNGQQKAFRKAQIGSGFITMGRLAVETGASAGLSVTPSDPSSRHVVNGERLSLTERKCSVPRAPGKRTSGPAPRRRFPREVGGTCCRQCPSGRACFSLRGLAGPSHEDMDLHDDDKRSRRPAASVSTRSWLEAFLHPPGSSCALCRLSVAYPPNPGVK
ncbi:unnamed protein product [Boreogadus saida]